MAVVKRKEPMLLKGKEENEGKRINTRTTRFEDRYDNCSPATAPGMLVGIS
jgi:hypothetical protein